jgi:hypothetical protein
LHRLGDPLDLRRQLVGRGAARADEQHRDLGELRHGPQPAEDAAVGRQGGGVDGDEVGLDLGCQLQALVAGVRLEHHRAEVAHGVGELRAVVDHQYGLLGKRFGEPLVHLLVGQGTDLLAVLQLVGLVDPLGGMSDQGDGEGRAPAPAAARGGELVAHQAAQRPRDAEPEAGAAVPSAGAAVGLAEFLEDALQLVPRDADAGVDDFDPYRRPALGADRDPHPYLPLGGELEGVRDQVHQHLGQLAAVACDRRHPRRHLGEELDRGGAELRRELPDGLLHQPPEVHRLQLHLHVAGLDLR